MTEPPVLMSSSTGDQPTNFAADFLGKRSFDRYSDGTRQPGPTVNALATGDARMIVGGVNTTNNFTGEVKRVKVYQFPEVQVDYSSRIAKDGATIRRWLTSTDQKSIYEEIRNQFEPSTNLWLTKDEGFERWAQWKSDSFIAKSIKREDSPTTTASPSTSTTKSIHVDNEMETENVTAWSSNFVWLHGGDVMQKVLTEVLKTEQVFFIIDALDEVAWGAQREDLLDFLKQLPDQAPENLRILVSSRNEPDIKGCFGCSNMVWKDIPVKSEEIDKDIEKYINSGIEKHQSLRRQSDVTKGLIRKKLIQNANGMFRWSALQLSSLKRLRSTTPNAISQALQKLPKDLNETYERILSSIDEYSMSSAVKSLKWLVVSKRTLYMEELADAVSDELRDLEQTPYEFRDVVPEPFHLVEMLGDLIQVQPALHDNSSYKPRQHKIVLAHFSVQEFLLKDYIKTSSASKFSFTLDQAHSCVAQDCLVYLYRFNSEPRRLDSVKRNVLNFVLKEYAWYNWEKHVLPAEAGVNEVISDPVRRKATILWGGYFEPPTGPRDNPRWFGHKLPKPEDKEIALISILPCLDPEDDLRCQLNIFNLDQKPAFKAISYALGPADDSPIFIGGSRKSVRPQLSNIFRNLRSHQEGQQPRFWADAISLEEWQSNSSSLVVERQQIYYTESRLLVMLTEIFKAAQEVAVSLGEEMPDDKQAIALIYKLVDLKDLAIRSAQHKEPIEESRLFAEVSRLESDGGWSILGSLLSRTWWQRRWTIQEIVLARSAVIFVGNIAFSFDVLARFVEAEVLIRQCLLEIHGPLGQGYHEIFDSPEWDSIRNLSRSRQEYSNSGPLDLMKLLWRFRSHTGMYREDVLRTILPLTWKVSSKIGLDITLKKGSPFQMDLPEALAELSGHMMRSSTTLDILSLQSAYSIVPEAEKDNASPSSWFPALERDAVEVQPLANALGMAGDEQTRLFAASTPLKLTYQLGSDNEAIKHNSYCEGHDQKGSDFGRFPQNSDLGSMSSRLSLQGANIDTIIRLSGAYTSGIRDKAILDFARKLATTASAWIEEWRQKQSDSDTKHELEGVMNGAAQLPLSSESIWRTLFADQYHLGARLPQQFPSPNLPPSLPPQNDEEVENLLSVPTTHVALRYLYGRRLLLTKNGRIGLAPFDAREGDTVAIFAGGSVPYLVRSNGKRLLGHFIDIPLWDFIGECYVHGIMDGELLIPRDDGKLNVTLRPFVLEGEKRKILKSERPHWREETEQMIDV
ncbi:unnamed protein product [Alternaria alternata]